MTEDPRNSPQIEPGWAVRSWFGPLGVALIAIVCGLGGAFARGALRYDRLGLEQGEVWRLVTGHLVHLGPAHLVMNLVALGIMGALFVPSMPQWRHWLGASLVAGLAIDAGLYWFEPNVTWYVGLSGVLHGLWAAGGLKSLRTHLPSAILLLLMLIGKLLWEQWAGPLPFSEGTAGGTVIVKAHLYGAVGGLLWFTVDRSVRRLGGWSL